MSSCSYWQGKRFANSYDWENWYKLIFVLMRYIEDHYYNISLLSLFIFKGSITKRKAQLTEYHLTCYIVYNFFFFII